jgi:hypothetical protein
MIKYVAQNITGFDFREDKADHKYKTDSNKQSLTELGNSEYLRKNI